MAKKKKKKKPEPVEIKVTVASAAGGGGTVADAMGALGLGEAGMQRAIWFLEDCTPGLPTALPLLESGIVVRLRHEPDGQDDSTVKLRPCRRSQLTRAWQREVEGPGWKFRIEEDWAGSRHTLAASCVADLAGKILLAAVERRTGLGGLFHARQKKFLASCADLSVNLGGLVALGPITAVRWDDLHINQYNVVAERWIVDALDFLELSIRDDDGRATATGTQAAFETALRERDVPVLEGETKTRTVLAYMAHLARDPKAL